jgi:hypothetical protein
MDQRGRDIRFVPKADKVRCSTRQQIGSTAVASSCFAKTLCSQQTVMHAPCTHLNSNRFDVGLDLQTTAHQMQRQHCTQRQKSFLPGMADS